MNSPTISAESAPQLAAPGAGLPFIELQVARLLFTLHRWKGSRAAFTAAFERERDTILALARGASAEQAARRVLIRRLPGMEDSSRYWSVWMTLEHLRIIHLGVARTMEDLARGENPPGEASTAAVKPSPGADASSVAAFERSCTIFLHTASKISNLRTSARFRHPWFGALNAEGWYAMGGFHLNLHRQQVERILAETLRDWSQNREGQPPA